MCDPRTISITTDKTKRQQNKSFSPWDSIRNSWHLCSQFDLLPKWHDGTKRISNSLCCIILLIVFKKSLFSLTTDDSSEQSHICLVARTGSQYCVPTLQGGERLIWGYTGGSTASERPLRIGKLWSSLLAQSPWLAKCNLFERNLKHDFSPECRNMEHYLPPRLPAFMRCRITKTQHIWQKSLGLSCQKVLAYHNLDATALYSNREGKWIFSNSNFIQWYVCFYV